MSIRALNWSRSVVVGDATAKSILRDLADYADEKGTCFPGQDELAREAELSERSVRRALKILEHRGFISVIRSRRKDGTLGGNRYKLHLSTTFPKAEMPSNPASSRVEPAEVSSSGSGCMSPLRLSVECSEPPEESSAGPPEVASSGPPEVYDRTTGSNFRSLTTNRRTYLRKSAHAEISEEDARLVGSSDPNFVRLVAAWPAGALDSREAAHEAWRKLTLEEQSEAAELASAFLAERRKFKRDSVIGLPRYIAEQQWRGVKRTAGRPALAGVRIFVPRKSAAWRAWDAHLRATEGRPAQSQYSPQHREDGWWFVSLWPPGGEPKPASEDAA